MQVRSSEVIIRKYWEIPHLSGQPASPPIQPSPSISSRLIAVLLTKTGGRVLKHCSAQVRSWLACCSSSWTQRSPLRGRTQLQLPSPRRRRLLCYTLAWTGICVISWLRCCHTDDGGADAAQFLNNLASVVSLWSRLTPSNLQVARWERAA